MDKDAGLGGKNGNSKEACLRKQEGSSATQTNYHAVQSNGHSAEDDIGFSAGKRDVACHSNEGSKLTQSNCHAVKEPPSRAPAEIGSLHLCSRQSHGHPASACSNSTLHTYNWRGVQFQLPSALRLAPGCTLNDELLEFRGSFQVLERAVVLLEEVELGLQYDLVDGALWISMPSSLLTDMLPAPVEHQLALWRERCEINQQYEVSASSAMIYSSEDSKMLIADCYIFRQEVFMRGKELARRQHRIVPRDVEAEVAFEFVSATDDVEEIWSKCKRFIASRRAKLAIGICDRENQKEVLIAFNDRHGNVHTEIRQDPRYIDLGRVLPEFRIYFSYMMPVVISHFTAHHQLDLHNMHKKDLQFQLCEAISRGFNELAMEIVNGLDTVNFKDEGGRNPLVVAVSSGNIEMIHFFLANKANPKYPDGDNICALLYAKANDLQVCDVLKAGGGDLDVSIGDLCNAVEKGSQGQFEMLLKVLLSNGVHIDSEQVHGYTALSLAVSSSNKTWAVSRLIGAGACPTKVDSSGTIPLIKAISSMSDKEIVDSSILHAQNMDLEVVRSIGINLARVLGRPMTVEALLALLMQ